MLRTIEARVEPDGFVRLLEPVNLPNARRALVMILDESPRISDTPLLSQDALAREWSRPEEDEAWSCLQQEW
ncbi:MAG: hypothetical protein HY000_03715 [Planctomycetes bacterium]|nr:hypothetical protein [Planctomycetota bacterium]